MDYGVRKKVDTRVNLLGNKLVLIAAKDAKIDHVTIGLGFDLAKLAGDGRVATGDVREVPVGLYAKAALERLGASALANRAGGVVEKYAKIFVKAGLEIHNGPTKPTTVFPSFADRWTDQRCTYAVWRSSPVDPVPSASRLGPGVVIGVE